MAECLISRISWDIVFSSILALNALSSSSVDKESVRYLHIEMNINFYISSLFHKGYISTSYGEKIHSGSVINNKYLKQLRHVEKYWNFMRVHDIRRIRGLLG